MFLFGRNVAQGARLRALRALYRSFNEQNGPEARARRLLREWLSPEQRTQFDVNGFFEVTGSLTGRRYRIHQGTMSNVLELDEKLEPKVGWCFLPERALAVGDVMLAQKIALETDEAAVLAIAKSFSPRLPFVPRAVRRAP
ncbi:MULTISPECIES: hypothetical protein [unclassified Bradyrhizobium]|uniref:hypothetical protein n=1 Tax=unclassified Bradyrhizobium TaxID=2631580 RepID=UPI001FF85AC3|nr:MULTISPECIES: hypothetical protein [unclassified Bradyrhizobium]MCK1325322.1 hypothetical protein [Bradyrhizobium sp. 156]MCK1573558.1 hypothetical protein [Bradyrhizobium sp. 174]MCK1696104.1 hypothetical protein [Bradyrhizobium sp. 144]UPK20676.1 hypothetical protein IVA73_06765 [Bradyrhizobium sp. 131]